MLTLWHQPQRDAIAARVNEFLQGLPGPTAIHLDGIDTSRSRVLVTLSHGNETSGLAAVHQWLRSGQQPQVNTIIILGAVAAALTEPLFFYRHLPGQRDLNRCFSPPYNDPQGRLAEAILAHIRASEPEAVVDMHNTSGRSPAFAVTAVEQPGQHALIGHFVERLLITELRLGSLMEQDCGCPVVTIEAGGSQDRSSDAVARRGLQNYFMSEALFTARSETTVFRHPLRLELAPQSRIDFADRALPDRDITVRADIERFNFAALAPEDSLAWLDADGFSHLRLGGVHRSREVAEFFRIASGRLYSARPMRLFMATTRADIAASDCLFYFVCD